MILNKECLKLSVIKNKDNKWLELTSSSLFYYILLGPILLRLLIACIVETLYIGVVLHQSLQLQGQSHVLGA